MNENTNTNQNTETEVQGQEQEVKTYTQEEVDALLQSEADRRVTAALQKQAKKNEEKLKEAEKLAAMNEEEKYQYQLEQREKAIIEKERELTLAENKATAMGILADKGISTTLVDFVLAESADDMKANIDLLDRAFKASVRAEVEKRLSSTNPKREKTASGATKDVSKMTYDELMQLKSEDPEYFKSLM